MPTWDKAAIQQMLQGLSGYQDVPRLASDVEEVVREIRSLQPKVDSLVKNDGTDKTLVVLDGTIPMFHNQKKYNCPVRFWLVLDYPMSPPICYVSPTRDMGIKPRHVHVDNAGFIYHQYLTQWNVRSTLKDLCSTLTTVFSKDPPVYAKPQGGQATHPPHQQSTPQPQPVQQPPQQQPQQQPPSHPPQQAAARASKPAPASGSSHVLQPPQHLPSQASGHPGPSSLASLPSNLLGGDTQRQPPAVADAELEAALALSAQLAAADKHSTVEQESKESLIFFVMSKINAKYEDLRRGNESEFDRYQSQQRDLEITQKGLSEGHQALAAEKTFLLNLLDEMDQAEAVICTYLDHLEERTKPRGEDAPQVETLVHTSDSLAQQLMDCVSHDRALEDVLYELDCAMSEGNIETAEYLRLVHKLSRQQFLEKELALKILAKRRSMGVY